ncbi:MAG: M3 family oligoendopeptidase [Lachnospiraceae bacterium]|nr:M3 family oligoendopeptidase [Lachnospiraceae bacterium]
MEKFSEIKYVRPDLKKFEAFENECLDKMEKASSFEEFKKVLFELGEADKEIGDMVQVCYIRSTMDKSDKFYETEQNWLDEELPKLMTVNKRYSNVLLNSPFRKEFDEEFGKILNETEEKKLILKDERLVPLIIEENKLSQEYSSIAAKCICNFRGEECNFYGLLRHMQSTDRAERKEAFEAWAGLYEGVSKKLDEVYDKLVAIRVKKAQTVGFDNYREYELISSEHFDYTKADLTNFKKQVVEIIVPEVTKLYKEQQERLGLDKLEYYDETLVFPEGNAKPIGNKDQMVKWAQEMYSELSPETKEFFDFMVKYELFDLETRPNKHLGGYMTLMEKRKAPFIFSNFNGTSADVEVLTHEAGHSFEGYVSSRIHPLSALIMSTSDIDEIHSMTMEHLTYPWMDKFFGNKADKFRYAHLTEALKVIPYLCAVDEFQCRVFDKPDMTAEERYAAWHDIEKTFLPWRSYDGNEFLEKGGFWMQKQHIFLYPFYYIDYALAQICAFQIYGKSLKNKEEGWNSYLTLCKLGGSRGYLDLLKGAGLESPFKDGSVKKAVEGALKQIKVFERSI